MSWAYAYAVIRVDNLSGPDLDVLVHPWRVWAI